MSSLSGIKDEIETNEMSLFVQWYLGRLPSADVCYLKVNHEIERDHHVGLIKNVKQQSLTDDSTSADLIELREIAKYL